MVNWREMSHGEDALQPMQGNTPPPVLKFRWLAGWDSPLCRAMLAGLKAQVCLRNQKNKRTRQVLQLEVIFTKRKENSEGEGVDKSNGEVGVLKSK